MGHIGDQNGWGSQGGEGDDQVVEGPDGRRGAVAVDETENTAWRPLAVVTTPVSAEPPMIVPVLADDPALGGGAAEAPGERARPPGDREPGSQLGPPRLGARPLDEPAELTGRPQVRPAQP